MIQGRKGTTLVSQLRMPGQSGYPPEVTPASADFARSGPPESPWQVSWWRCFGRQHSERESCPRTRPAGRNVRGHFLSLIVPNSFSPKFARLVLPVADDDALRAGPRGLRRERHGRDAGHRTLEQQHRDVRDREDVGRVLRLDVVGHDVVLHTGVAAGKEDGDDRERSAGDAVRGGDHDRRADERAGAVRHRRRRRGARRPRRRRGSRWWERRRRSAESPLRPGRVSGRARPTAGATRPRRSRTSRSRGRERDRRPSACVEHYHMSVVRDDPVELAVCGIVPREIDQRLSSPARSASS